MEGMKINVVLMSVVFVICMSGSAALQCIGGDKNCTDEILNKWDTCLDWNKYIAMDYHVCRRTVDHQCAEEYAYCIQFKWCYSYHLKQRYNVLDAKQKSIQDVCTHKGDTFDANKTKNCLLRFFGPANIDCKKQHISDNMFSRFGRRQYDLCDSVGKWKCCLYQNISQQCGKSSARVFVTALWKAWGQFVLKCDDVKKVFECYKQFLPSSRAGPFGMTDGGPAPLLLMTSLIASLLAAGGPRLLRLMTSLMT